MSEAWHDQYGALAHAGPDGHVCGREAALRIFAVATLEQCEGASDVFVTPTETHILFHEEAALGAYLSSESMSEVETDDLPDEGWLITFRNGDAMREAIDRYLLDGDVEGLAGAEFVLEPPRRQD
jgi:hypothetical protein